MRSENEGIFRSNRGMSIAMVGRMTNVVASGLHRRKWTWTLLFVLLMTTLAVGPTQAISRLIDASSQLVDKVASALTRFESARRGEESLAADVSAPQGLAVASDVATSTAVSLSEASDDSEWPADHATSASAAAVTGSTDSQRQSPSTSAAPRLGLTARRGTFGFNPSRHPNISDDLGLPSLSLELFPMLGLPDEADIGIRPLAHATAASAPAGGGIAAGAAGTANAASAPSAAAGGMTGAPGPIGTLRPDDVESPASTFVESLKEGIDLSTQLELGQQSSLFTTLDPSDESESPAAVGTSGVRAVATPEPSTLALLSFGVAAAARLRRRRSQS